MGLLGGGSYYEVEPFPLEAEMACFHPDDERRANLRSWNGIGNTKPKYSINVYVNICGIHITAIFKKNMYEKCLPHAANNITQINIIFWVISNVLIAHGRIVLMAIATGTWYNYIIPCFCLQHHHLATLRRPRLKACSSPESSSSPPASLSTKAPGLIVCWGWSLELLGPASVVLVVV